MPPQPEPQEIVFTNMVGATGKVAYILIPLTDGTVQIIFTQLPHPSRKPTGTLMQQAHIIISEIAKKHPEVEPRKTSIIQLQTHFSNPHDYPKGSYGVMSIYPDWDCYRTRAWEELFVCDTEKVVSIFRAHLESLPEPQVLDPNLIYIGREIRVISQSRAS